MGKNSFKKTNLYKCNLEINVTNKCSLFPGTLKFNEILKMSFKNIKYISQKLFYFINFLNIEKLPKLFHWLIRFVGK